MFAVTKRFASAVLMPPACHNQSRSSAIPIPRSRSIRVSSRAPVLKAARPILVAARQNVRPRWLSQMVAELRRNSGLMQSRCRNRYGWRVTFRRARCILGDRQAQKCIALAQYQVQRDQLAKVAFDFLLIELGEPQGGK